jgi:hypothetical protein
MRGEEQVEHLWTRAGHLTGLTLDRRALGELGAAELEAVEDHLGGCAACQAEVARVAAFDAGLSLPPLSLAPAWGGRVVPLRRRWWPAALGAAAAAAAALWLALPGLWDATDRDGDGIRLKGRVAAPVSVGFVEGDFAWEVLVHDEGQTRAVGSGDRVHPGERLGFRVHPRRSGYLLIVGEDDGGQGYLCYPQRGGGAGALLGASDRPYALEEAVRLDEVLGHERLTALYCPGPVSMGERAPEGCLRRALVLQKEAR